MRGNAKNMLRAYAQHVFCQPDRPAAPGRLILQLFYLFFLVLRQNRQPFT